MAVKIIPSILTDDPRELERMVRLAETFTDYVQIDIADGDFVPSHSIICEDLVEVAPRIAWEAHLMVDYPEEYLADFQKAGAKKVIFHYEAAPSPNRVINKALELGIKVGLAANPETPAASLFPFLDDIDGVLLLTVNPGFYGSRFILAILAHINILKAKNPDIKVSIDGGIKEENIAQVVHSGADAVCIGSGIFWSSDPAASFRRFNALASEALLGTT